VPTYTELMRGFEFGPWSVIPERGLIRDGEDERHLEPLVMDVFVVLASHYGEVVTKDQLIDEVWEGRPQTDDVITRCISALRRGLRDDAKAPKYIETVQRRGYRAMLSASMPDLASELPMAAKPSVRPDLWMIVVGLLAVGAIAFFALIPRGPGPTDGLSSVAVYPFDCLQDTRGTDAHLCFGFAEEAITSLNQIDNMQIVRKRKAYNDSENVVEDSIVTGSVQIIADEVKIAAQLEDARSGVVIWSETFDAGKSGIFEMQRQVASSLRAVLDADFSASASGPREPSSYAAAEAYALGRYLFEKRDHQSIVDAVKHFEVAIRLDPTYGPAWLGLAYTYSIWPDYDLTIDRQAAFDKALEIIGQGVEADPSIREAAGTVYGYVFHKRYQWIEAMENTSMAVNSESAGADAYNWHSRVLASVGRMDESLEFARIGAELDPDDPSIIDRLAIASFWFNDLENAARHFEIAERMNYEASIHSLAYSLFLIRTGDIEEAKLRATEGLEENNLESGWVGIIFDGIADEMKRPAAITVLEQVYASGAMPDNVAITLWVLLGNPDQAMAIARRSEGDGGLFEIEIIYIDEFREFRQHPRFNDFVTTVGLTAYWENAGCAWLDDRVTCED
jgi:DNA-binding winged helix-turn-helix (wHTH) protein/TolB-like protein